MRRARTRCSWIEERTLRIGFGIKRASQHQVASPELLALGPPLGRCQAVPFRPFLADKLFRRHHRPTLPRLSSGFKEFVASWGGQLTAKAGRREAWAILKGADGTAFGLPSGPWVRRREPGTGVGVEDPRAARGAAHRDPGYPDAQGARIAGALDDGFRAPAARRFVSIPDR